VNSTSERAGEARTTQRVRDDDEPELLDDRHKKHEHWNNVVEAQEFVGTERTSILGVTP
jgi:hypothetical protein